MNVVISETKEKLAAAADILELDPAGVSPGVLKSIDIGRKEPDYASLSIARGAKLGRNQSKISHPADRMNDVPPLV